MTPTLVRNLMDPSSFSCSFKTLQQEVKAILIAVENLRPVHDWDVSAIDLEDNDLSHPDVLLLVVGQEEKVSSLQRMRSKSKATCLIKPETTKTVITMAKQKEKLFKEETWKAGSMLPERTTTMGDSEPVTTIRPFQIIRAEDTIIPNDNTWNRT